MVSIRKYMGEGVGWIGAIFSLMAFSLNSLNFISSQSGQYLGMNIVGCLFIILYAVSKNKHMLVGCLTLSFCSWLLLH